MIHIWNRVELLVTYELDQLNRVRDALAAAGINYIYRTKDLVSPTIFASANRAYTGTFGVKHDARVEYKIFVCRSDFARAKALL